jgi:hypothetical protein
VRARDLVVLAMVVLAAPLACKDYRAQSISEVPRGLSSYRSIAIRTSASRASTATAEDIAVFEEDLAKRLQKSKVFSDVVRGEASAELVCRVTIEEAGSYETMSLQGGGGWSAKAVVELVEQREQPRTLGGFTVSATDKTAIPDFTKMSGMQAALVNVSAGIAAQIKKRR